MYSARYRAYRSWPLRVACALWLLGCATNDPIPLPEDGDNDADLTTATDYVLFTRSGSSANGFVTGFDSFPSGDLNVPALPTTVAYPAISGGVAYGEFVVNQQKLFGGPGYQRVSLDENFRPVDGRTLETFGGGSAIVVRDSTKGYYVDFNTLNLQVFDPRTFTRLGEVDMSAALTFPANQANYYSGLYVRGNRLYACLFTGRNFPPFLYDSPVGAVVAVVDTDADVFLKNITFPNTKYPGQPFLRFNSLVVDEAGNLYVPTQGGLGLEPGGGPSTPAIILKIPAGRDDFDPDYAFISQRQLAGAADGIVLNGGFLYAGNGVAYTNVLMTPPASLPDLINRPLARWAKVDLVNQTAALVEGMPPNAGLTAGMAYRYRDKVQLVVYNPDQNISALYETDITRDDATQVFRVTAGGIIYGFYEVQARAR